MELRLQVDKAKTVWKDNWINYPLCWIIANQIVQRYFERHGIDAQPAMQEGVGWDCIKLTGLEVCQLQNGFKEAAWGKIYFRNMILESGAGKRPFEFGEQLLNDPLLAMKQIIDSLDIDNPSVYGKEAAGSQIERNRYVLRKIESAHKDCNHFQKGSFYTALFQAITEVILSLPTAQAARELWIDVTPYDPTPFTRPLHPLRRLEIAEPGISYEWFSLRNKTVEIFWNVKDGTMIHHNQIITWDDYKDETEPEDLIMLINKILFKKWK
ncbi:MAG: hypothetical protein ACFFCQ_09960 [Promethearchaeota archaeon]